MTTGVDFELELWLVHRKFHFSLVFQAKKFVKPNDSYVAKLNYPKQTQGQLRQLLGYAKKHMARLTFMPFTASLIKARKPCVTNTKHQIHPYFIVDAHTIREFANGKHGKRISKNKILKASNPFHCMFCWPLTQLAIILRATSQH